MKDFPRHIWLIATLVLIASNCFAQSQYRFQHYDTKNGLPNKTMFSIAQDSLGFMWFQYYGGLARFDGYNFKAYKHDEDDSSSVHPGTVGGIVSRGAGGIWITPNCRGCETYAIAKYDRKTERFIGYQLKLVQRNSDVLLRLNNQLLDLAKLESGTMKIEKSNSDINSFIRAITGSFESLARHKNVTLSVEIPLNRHPWIFDKDKLELGCCLRT